jgi:hypothetical protein
VKRTTGTIEGGATRELVAPWVGYDVVLHLLLKAGS